MTPFIKLLYKSLLDLSDTTKIKQTVANHKGSRLLFIRISSENNLDN